MATKKKAKKKAVSKPRKAPTINTLALSLRDDVLHILNSVRQDGAVMRHELVRIREDMLAMREATERLDRDVAKLDAETFRQLVELVRIDMNRAAPFMAEYKHTEVRGGVGLGETELAAHGVAATPPTDAELLS